MNRPVDRWIVRLIPIVMVIAACTARAVQGQATVRDTVELEDLVATATRVPLSRGSLTAAVTVISGDDLADRGVRFVSDALRDIPGAAIVPVGSYGGVTSLFLRGGESDYVKILVDGVALNLPGGAYNLANLTTDNVDRIEVVRGPTSVLYGSDAVTGVVQIFTKRGRPGIDAAVNATAGTFRSTAIGGRISGADGDGRVNYALAGSRFTTNGTAAFNSVYASTVGSGVFRAALDGQTHATLTARFDDNTVHFPTDGTGVPSDSNQFSFDQSWALSLEFTRQLGSAVEGLLTVTRYAVDGGFDDRPDHSADTVGYAFASTRAFEVVRQSIDARVNVFATRPLSITAGTTLDFDRERQSGDATSNFGAGVEREQSEPVDATRRNLGVYAQVLLEFSFPASLHLGMRLDENDTFGSFFTYRAGAVYRVGRETRLRASIGTGFKAPTFAEHFADAPFEVGNPSLEPERSIGWEVGAEHRAWGGRMVVWADYFDQRFRDLVQYVFAEPGVPTYRNLPQALARGVEAGISVAPGAGVTASAQYTYLHSETTDAGANPAPGTAFELGRPLVRRPAHAVQLAGSARLGRGSRVSLRVNHVGARDDLAFENFASVRVELPSYTTLEASGMVEILSSRPGRPGLSAHLRIENVLDQGYETVKGFPGRGRTVSIGAALLF